MLFQQCGAYGYFVGNHSGRDFTLSLWRMGWENSTPLPRVNPQSYFQHKTIIKYEKKRTIVGAAWVLKLHVGKCGGKMWENVEIISPIFFHILQPKTTYIRWELPQKLPTFPHYVGWEYGKTFVGPTWAWGRKNSNVGGKWEKSHLGIPTWERNTC